MDNEADPLVALWKSQKQGEMSLSLKEIRLADRKFRRRIRIRNILEWGAAFLCIYFFGKTVFLDKHWLIRLGAAELALSALYIAWKVAKDGRPAMIENTGQSAESYLHEHLSNLRRQARFLGTTARWYFAPIALGWSMMWVGSFISKIAEGESALGWLVYLVLAVVFFLWGIRINRKAASRYECKIEKYESQSHFDDEHRNKY